jgi:hypothetical protein
MFLGVAYNNILNLPDENSVVAFSKFDDLVVFQCRWK